MAETRWNVLQTDCLVHIFAKLDTEKIAESVQYVCKSWYQATLDPKCWQTLIFTKRLYSDDFVEFAVRRSQNSAIVVIFRRFYDGVSDRSLLYISQNCPKLKVLLPPYAVVRTYDGLIKDAICNWKDLEYIKLCRCDYYGDILESISLHCKNFCGLICPNSGFGDEEASLIVKYLPKIKCLRMRGCTFPRSSLVMILKCCKELEFLDVSSCIGFDEMDDEIRTLASNINTFNSEGSMLYDYDDDYNLSSRDVDFCNSD